MLCFQSLVQQASAARDGVDAGATSSLGDEKCGRRFCSKTEETMAARGVWSSLVSALSGMCTLM
jgi:hypothetical protein